MAALDTLIANDIILIEKKVKEECINHRLAVYIEKELRKVPENMLNNICVDLEYNKHYDSPKEIIDEQNKQKNIRPDIIVHQRHSNEFNFAVFEIKKEYTTFKDLQKVKSLLEEPYRYGLGCLVSYLPKKPYIIIKFLYKEQNQILIENRKMEKNQNERVV